MSSQIVSAFRLNANYEMLLAALKYWGLDTDDIFTRFYNRLVELEINNLYEVIAITGVGNDMVQVVYSTSSGNRSLQIRKERLSDSYKFMLVDVSKNIPDEYKPIHLFTLQGTSNVPAG